MDGVEPEWKRVVPTDKELKLYLEWKWQEDKEEKAFNVENQIHQL